MYEQVLVIILVILVVGIGVLITDKMGITTQETKTMNGENVIFYNVTAYGIIYGVPAHISTLITLDSIYNATGMRINTNNITLNTGVNITINATYLDGIYNVSYTYLADSATTSSLNSARDAIKTINTEWISIIILILIMSLVIGMVIYTLIQKKR